MNVTDTEKTSVRLLIIWWVALTCAWSLFIYRWGGELYAIKVAEYAQSGWLAHFFHYGDPSVLALLLIVVWLCGSWFLRFPANFFAEGQAEWSAQRQTARHQRAIQSTLNDMTNQSEANRKALERSHLQEKVINRLVAVDNYLRVLEGEPDRSERIVALQEAQSEIGELEAKQAAGVFPNEVFTERAIVAHAQATREHLVRLGLEKDRLHQELVRLFKLPG